MTCVDIHDASDMLAMTNEFIRPSDNSWRIQGSLASQVEAICDGTTETYKTSMSENLITTLENYQYIEVLSRNDGEDYLKVKMFVTMDDWIKMDGLIDI